MAGWIFDEDIARPTVKEYSKAGIKGLHIKDDLNEGGANDQRVLAITKEKKSTLITANTRDFLKVSDVDYHKSYGVWILQTEDPKEQVRQVKATIEVTGLDTLNKRKELKLHIKEDEVEILDIRTQKKVRYKLPAKGKHIRKKR